MTKLFPLVLTAVLALTAACGPRPFTGAPRDFPIQPDGTVQPVGAAIGGYEAFSEYVVAPGDQLEVLYRFEPGPAPEFKLAPEDLIHVRFLEVPELDSEQRVRPDGTISLPFFHQINVSGMTLTELNRRLEEMYAKVLQEPKIYILVREFHTSIQELKSAVRNDNTGAGRMVLVRGDGHATFPALGDVPAAGLKFQDLAALVQQRYADISKDIRVDVMLNKSSGSRIYVVGAVTQPGMFSLDRPVHPLQAIAMAGGYRTDAALDQVIVVRREGNRMVCTPYDVEAAIDGRAGGNFAYLRQNDIVLVPRTRISEAAQIAEQISAVSFFRGYSLGFSYELHSSNNDNNN